MPPVVIDIRSAEDSRDVVHRAVQALAEGKLVALPTETVYGLAASALDERADRAAVGNQAALDGQGLDPGDQECRRRARLCAQPEPAGTPAGPPLLAGPGDAGHRRSASREPGSPACPPSVQQAVAPEGTIGLRVPAHQMVLDILRMLVGPVVLTSANRKAAADPVTAEEVLAALGDQVNWCSTTARAAWASPRPWSKSGRADFEILRPGVVSEQTLKRLSSLMILLVCTGNTCRSPMAEVMCRQMIAERLGCPIGELGDHGVMVMSAGMSAMMGSPAEPGGGERAGQDGAELGRSRIAAADHPIGAARRHHLDHDPLASAGDRGPMARGVAAHDGAGSRPSGHRRSDRRPGRVLSSNAPSRSKPSWPARGRSDLER